MMEICKFCGEKLIPRTGRYGVFLACPKSRPDEIHTTRSVIREWGNKSFVKKVLKDELFSKYYSEEDSSWYGKTEWQGSIIDTQWHDDGRTTYNWGGPCGSTTYDKYGEEC